MYVFERSVPHCMGIFDPVKRIWFYATALAIAKAINYFVVEGASASEVEAQDRVNPEKTEAPQVIRDYMEAVYVKAWPLRFPEGARQFALKAILQWCYTWQSDVVDANAASGLTSLEEMLEDELVGPSLANDGYIETLDDDSSQFSGYKPAAVLASGKSLLELVRNREGLYPLLKLLEDHAAINMDEILFDAYAADSESDNAEVGV